MGKEVFINNRLLLIFNILGKRRDNQNFTGNAKTLLGDSLGGLASLETKKPVCGGRYEAADGQQVFCFLNFCESFSE